MDYILTIEDIQATEAFKKLDKGIRPIYLKRVNREAITHALIVYNNTEYINNNLGPHQTSILKEIITKHTKIKTNN